MTYFHSYWTRPVLDPGRPGAEQELLWWDFEALTWLWSALELRQHGPLKLVTDDRGLLAVQRAGLEWVYTGGISTALERIPLELDPGTFWAAGKLYAYLESPAPCVSVDTDAVLLQPLTPTAPVMALHGEDRDSGWYRNDAALFSQFGFEGPNWDWSIHPINAGVVYLQDQKLLELYVETATRFMLECSQRYHGQSQAKREIPSNAMLFAEQRLLPMCAHRLGQALAFVTRQEAGPGWLPLNKECLHLWGAKHAYKLCPEARAAAVNHLRDQLLERFPEARTTLVRWALDKPRQVSPGDADFREALTHSSALGLTFSLLRQVRGLVSVRDRVLGARRQAREGSMIWSAEILEPEPGASCELLAGGQHALRLSHHSEQERS